MEEDQDPAGEASHPSSAGEGSSRPSDPGCVGEEIRSHPSDPGGLGEGRRPTKSRGQKEPEDPGRVTCVGGDMDCLPPSFIHTHSAVATRLDLSYNQLRSLQGVEEFQLLEELILDNNKLTDESLSNIPSLPHLHTLTLNKNNVCDIESLLAQLGVMCPKLRYLSLLGNQACPHEMLGGEHDDEDYQRYRYYVLYKLPKLTFLDSRTVTALERSEAKRKGQFTRIVKPTSNLFEDSGKHKPAALGYTPLPQSTPVAGQHRAVFGQCKYVYYGKHSEGNRFIRNNQL